MIEIKETCYKGTRILLGNKKRDLINNMINVLKSEGFQEISIPIIQHQEIFKGKVGEENNNLMFNFKDRGDRDLCLAPEYTAIVQQLSKSTFKHQKDVKLFYIQECFRGEKPQAGRYRQFTQLGIEVLNPVKNWMGHDFNYHLPLLAAQLLSIINYDIVDIVDKKVRLSNFNINYDVTRGLDYYKEGKGFEITSEVLGSSKQVCGGGEYEGGIGFAIGIDRLLNLIK